MDDKLYAAYREVAELREKLSKAEAHFESLARGKTVGASKPKVNGRSGPTFTDQVLAQVKGPRDAPSIVASLGLKADRRRAVYKVLAKAAEAGRIKKLSAGKFAPK